MWVLGGPGGSPQAQVWIGHSSLAEPFPRPIPTSVNYKGDNRGTGLHLVLDMAESRDSNNVTWTLVSPLPRLSVFCGGFALRKLSPSCGRMACACMSFFPEVPPKSWLPLWLK